MTMGRRHNGGTRETPKRHQDMEKLTMPKKPGETRERCMDTNELSCHWKLEGNEATQQATQLGQGMPWSAFAWRQGRSSKAREENAGPPCSKHSSLLNGNDLHIDAHISLLLLLVAFLMNEDVDRLPGVVLFLGIFPMSV